MRSRVLLLTIVLTTSVLALPTVAYAGIPFFGPIIPDEYAKCPASWGLVITVINNVISLALTLAIVFVAPLMVAWSGFLYVINPLSPGGKSNAKNMLQNAIGGIVVALAAWMIVGAFMAVLYHPTDPRLAGQTWQSLLTSGNIEDNKCLNVASGLNQVRTGNATTTGFVTGVNAIGQRILAFDPNSASSGACSAGALRSAVPSLSVPQANTFACLAKVESSCGTKMENYAWNKPIPEQNNKASTAYGAFQITLSGNAPCLENPVCLAAAGGSGPLNCQKGFGPKGFLERGDRAVRERCMKAAANLACNATAAKCVYDKQGYGAWQADKSSSLQAQCVAKYSSG